MPLVIISYNVVTVVYCKKWRAYLIKRLSLSEIYKAITDVVPGPNSFHESCFLIWWGYHKKEKRESRAEWEFGERAIWLV